MRAGVALRAVLFQLAVGAGVAVRTAAFHPTVGAGVARSAAVFPLAVRASLTSHSSRATTPRAHVVLNVVVGVAAFLSVPSDNVLANVSKRRCAAHFAGKHFRKPRFPRRYLNYHTNQSSPRPSSRRSHSLPRCSPLRVRSACYTRVPGTCARLVRARRRARRARRCKPACRLGRRRRFTQMTSTFRPRFPKHRRHRRTTQPRVPVLPKIPPPSLRTTAAWGTTGTTLFPMATRVARQ